MPTINLNPTIGAKKHKRKRQAEFIRKPHPAKHLKPTKPSKNSNTQYIIKTKHAQTIQKTTQLGVTEITPKPLKPLYFRHSQKYCVIIISPDSVPYEFSPQKHIKQARAKPVINSAFRITNYGIKKRAPSAKRMPENFLLILR